jgi:O-glycosyl hydrolase
MRATANRAIASVFQRTTVVVYATGLAWLAVAMKAFKPLFLLTLTLVACGACKKTPSNPPPPPPPPPPNATVDRVEITPATASVEVEQTVQLSARALDQNGNVLSKMIAWSSAAEATATVNTIGVVTGVAAGTAAIRATADGKTGTAQITVTPKNANPVATVEVTPETASIIPGETVALTAVAKDAGGAVLNGRSVSWSSDAQGVATVASTGVVTGVSAGTARITATVEGVTDSASIEVRMVVMTDGDVNIVPTTRHQEMVGWEGTAQIGQAGCQSFNNYRMDLIDRLVNELGINRVRLEIRSGTENTSDWFNDFLNNPGSNWRDRWYTPVNDNGDPSSIDGGRFYFSELDHQVDNVITPLQQALAMRGEQLYVLMCFVDFSQDNFYRHEPAEYGELMTAAYDHLQSTYGWVPDGIEIILEPDNSNANYTAQQVTSLIEGVGERMAAEGYSPDIVAPSSLNMWVGVNMLDVISQSPTAMQYLTEFSYHRYNGTGVDAAQAIAQRIQTLGIKSAMLEHINADINELWEDLTVANNSGWQQFALAFCDSSGGAAHYYEINDANGSFFLRPESRPFAQIFRHVRRGAVRFGTDVRDGALQALAFQNANGKWVTIVRTQGAESFTVGHLPPGTYGIDYTTDAELIATLPDATIAAGETITVSIPARGLITIFGR